MQKKYHSHPAQQILRLVGFQEASALEQPYDASTQSLLNPLKVLFGDGLNAMEVHFIGIGTEQAIGHTTVKVDMHADFQHYAHLHTSQQGL